MLAGQGLCRISLPVHPADKLTEEVRAPIPVLDGEIRCVAGAQEYNNFVLMCVNARILALYLLWGRIIAQQ